MRFWTPNFSLSLLLWVSEVIVCSIVVVPVWRFLSSGWYVRRQEFTNRFKKAKVDAYLDRFWDFSLALDPSIMNKPNQEKFLYVYNKISGRNLYWIPFTILVLCVFIFGGLVIANSIRSGYESYFQGYIDIANTEKLTAVALPPHLQTAEMDRIVTPFSFITLSLSSITAISGAYLFIVSTIIQGYRTRTLVSSDLWWCVFRITISIPLGLSISSVASPSFASFVGFGIGAFPMDAVTRLLRRLTLTAFNATEQDARNDQLVGLQGMTSNVAAQLAGEGIEAAQELAQVDPISLAVRAGLSFDFILNIVSQSQVWAFIGPTAKDLAPLGLGDARSIAMLVERLDKADPKAGATLVAAATTIKIDPDLLEFNFRNIAADSYTVFLHQFAADHA